MYIFFEKGTRGGIFNIFNRYSKANNNHLKSYDTKQESTHILYLDVNIFYVYTMLKFLPISGFKWIDPIEFDTNKCTSNNSKGCVLEVDLEYPEELQELHNYYTLAPDKMESKRKMLPKYQLKIVDLYNIPIGNNETLGPNFFDKEKYVLYYENLQLETRIKTKNNTRGIRIQSIIMVKTIH